MAVTPEQIKARLKAKYPKANLSQKRIDAIAAKLCLKPVDDADDDAIDLVLETANDFMSFEDIAKDDDRVRTLEANQKTKPEPTDPPTPTPTPTPPTPTDDPNKALLDAIAGLKSEMEAIKSGKITETKKISAQQAFEKSEVFKALKPEIKENWLKRISVTADSTDEEINEQVTSLEGEFTALRQSFADETGYTGPPKTGGPEKFSETDAQAIVDSII